MRKGGFVTPLRSAARIQPMPLPPLQLLHLLPLLTLLLKLRSRSPPGGSRQLNLLQLSLKKMKKMEKNLREVEPEMPAGKPFFLSAGHSS
jgi:hypothetical protein